jgi:predicted nucleic acid-binding Zn ribbon protein
MPIYEFKNTETGEIVELSMSISSREDYLKDNPHMSQVLGAPGLVRGSGGMKNDNGWKENLARISEAHPQSALAERTQGKSTTKSKVEQVAKKHGLLNRNRSNDTGAGRV